MIHIIATRKLCRPSFVFALCNRFRNLHILGSYELSPETLFRIANVNGTVAIREKSIQEAKSAIGYDYEAVNGQILPSPDNGVYVGQNGFALRPAGDSLCDTLSKLNNNTLLIELDSGTVFPDGMILIHEKAGHFSLQTTVPIKPALFSKNVNKFLSSKPTLTKEEYLSKYPYNRSNVIRSVERNSNRNETLNSTQSSTTPLVHSVDSAKITQSTSPPAITPSLHPIPTINITQAKSPSFPSKRGRMLHGERAATRVSSFRVAKESWKTKLSSGRTEGFKGKRL